MVFLICNCWLPYFLNP